MHVDTTRDLLGVLALQQVHEPGGELDVLDAAADLALGIRENLAVLGRDDRGELVGALDEQVAEAEEHVGALDEARRPPCGEGGGGRGDRGVGLCRRRESDLGLHRTGRRVVDGAGALGRSGRLAGDVVADEIHAVLLTGRAGREEVEGRRIGQIDRRMPCLC